MLQYMRRLLTYFNSRIRFKVILPFAILTLSVAIIGVYLSTRLVSGSLEERFTRQLVEAATISTDMLAQREEDQLEKLRAVSFTEGIDEAILNHDRAKLEALLFPLVVNQNIHRVDIIDASGEQILAIHRPPGSRSRSIEDYVVSRDTAVQEWDIWPIIQKVLSGVTDARGDKYVALTQIDGNHLFVTGGPVKQGDQIIGAALVSSYTRDMARSLAQATFAEVSLYNLQGALIDTTFPQSQEVNRALALGSEGQQMLAVDGQASLRRSTIVLGGRTYDILFGLFQARGELLGFYSVALQTTFIESYGATARNQMVFIFAATLLLVFGIGYMTANTITGRLQHLMENAMAVASGDFTRRTHVSSSDEIGSLARSLDHMTESLASYTQSLRNRIEELIVLYESSTAVTVKSGLNLDQVVQAIATSMRGIIHGTDQVVVHLLDSNQQLLIPTAASPEEAAIFPYLTFTEQNGLHDILANPKPQLIRLAEMQKYVTEGSFSANGTDEVLIAPLIAGQETIGLLSLFPDETHPQAQLLDSNSERLLGTLANQAAIAVKNAQLFETTQRAYKELQKLDDLKTEFINIAAHELRTPLGAMMGYASFIEKRVPPKLHKPTRFLVASSLRMRTMVDAMLTIQRLDAGTTFLHLTPVDIRDIFKKTVTDFQPMAELEGHTIEVSIPDRINPVLADAEKVGLILSNLLSNAIKFTTEGGRIEIKAQDYVQGILISVRDNGVGISPEDQQHIFERFYQVRPEHIAGHGGMGIGLTIVKQLAEMHQGQVWVESEPGKGSTFFVTLPRGETNEIDPALAQVQSNSEQDAEESLETAASA
jgi:signal transduction histidine kinase/HAMP domain-containing protein